MDAPCTFIVTTPSGKTEEVPTEKTPEGYDVKFTPKEKGKYTVKITYAVTEVPDSPFTVHVQTVDLSSVKVIEVNLRLKVTGYTYHISTNKTSFTETHTCCLQFTYINNVILN